MTAADDGYHVLEIHGLPPGALYRFRLDEGRARADPASHHQPRGVFGPSAVVDHDAFCWDDLAFHPPALSGLILYEIHIGTFTRAGTFEAASARLGELARLGVNAILVMPAAQFPGSRNWGYDGVFPFAAQDSYGGPWGLKTFVNACHGHGLAVILDVVYSHFGPEGNVLGDFGPYFRRDAKTPWGDAVDYDGPNAGHVRWYFLRNAVHWIDAYHVDGLRLDATQAISDTRPVHFLRELAETVRAHARSIGRDIVLLAENETCDIRLIRPLGQGGHGCDGLFHETFHKAARALFSSDGKAHCSRGGQTRDFAKTLCTWPTPGQRRPVPARSLPEGPGEPLPASSLVAFIQNHDQTGNRPGGKRLASLADFETLKTAAGLLLLSPFTPMLFMGEEYAEDAPFLYFVSHRDPALVRAVGQSREHFLARFAPDAGKLPDPGDPRTFRRCILNWERRHGAKGSMLLAFYTEVIRLRRTMHAPGQRFACRDGVNVIASGAGLVFAGGPPGRPMRCHFNVSSRPIRPFFHARWRCDGYVKVLDSADERFGGPGSAMPSVAGPEGVLGARSLAVYREGTGD